ncbi:phospholipid-transporting ATPase 2 [Spatholobus suberectus]|nr:phospholipid-transporting ATPase 2 [Spatholobus suberectus]
MKGRMDRDEDLTLFRELRKRQNERISSLLHCVNSEEFECGTNNDSGNFSLYRIQSGKKENGLGFLETNKNDYDWLKTPPATPLFPSLEMEAGPQLVVQKEIPISQPISRVGFATRFAWSDVEAPKPKSIDGKTNHVNSTKPKLSARSKTPSHNRQRPSIIKNTNQQPTSTPLTITNKSSNAKIDHDTASVTKSTPQKQANNVDFLALNIKKSIETNESPKKPRARGVSPSTRSRVVLVSNMVELSNETPPNLRTNQRSSSTTRGRSTTQSSTVAGFQNQDPTPRVCRPSRSPSPSMANGGWNQLDRTQKNLRSQKETFTLAAGTNESRAHFKGSKMVEKVVNARKSGMNQTDRETKAKAFKYRV